MKSFKLPGLDSHGFSRDHAITSLILNLECGIRGSCMRALPKSLAILDSHPKYLYM